MTSSLVEYVSMSVYRNFLHIWDMYQILWAGPNMKKNGKRAPSLSEHQYKIILVHIVQQEGNKSPELFTWILAKEEILVKRFFSFCFPSFKGKWGGNSILLSVLLLQSSSFLALRLTSWLSCVWCFIVFFHIPMWCPGSGAVLACIDSWSLPPYWYLKLFSWSTQLSAHKI